ncbi:hypothetical protein ILYODFUR_030205 [Ilyodon furcidens]|uniref:Uncharacterized protein n=1 Tax=Ilyodon furcidens TaxID=33524 RepID=A0ABV0TMZ3_9TELE
MYSFHRNTLNRTQGFHNGYTTDILPIALTTVNDIFQICSFFFPLVSPRISHPSKLITFCLPDKGFLLQIFSVQFVEKLYTRWMGGYVHEFTSTVVKSHYKSATYTRLMQ